MKEIYIKNIAQKLDVKEWQVENCVKLFEEGATIPFISRYRKERTGGLDEVAVAEIRHWSEVFEDMEKRKNTILETIGGLGKLSPELRTAVENCVDSRELEDLYLPYRPKRRTRATAAKEAGLEPLADRMYSVSLSDPLREASGYVNDKVPTPEDALAGARDIIAERLSETASVRETLRGIFNTRRLVSKATKKAVGPEAAKYKGYFDYSESLSRIAPHRLLAMLRAEEEGYITLKIDADPEKCGKKLYYDFCQERRYPAAPLAEQIHEAIDDSYKRLLEPSITNEVISQAKEKADIESVKIFGENLRQLLLASPVGQKRTLAIDPGFRTGCKVVCLDEQGNLLHNETIYGCIRRYNPQYEKVNASFNGEKIKTVAVKRYREALLERLRLCYGDPKKAFTGRNALDKNPLFTDKTHTEKVPLKVKTVTLETVYTQRQEVNKDLNLDKVVDKKVKTLLEERLQQYGGDKVKAFSNLDENPIWLNKEKGIQVKRVTITGKSNVVALHDKRDNLGRLILDKDGNKQPVDFVSTSNNHHVAIFRDVEGNLQEHVVSFYEATARDIQHLPVIDKDYKKDEGWQFLFTMKQNEYFVFPNSGTGFDPKEIDLLDPRNYAEISKNLYRVQKLSTKNYFFRHHLETSVEDKKELKGIAWKNIRTPEGLGELVKVRVNHLGQIVSVGEY